MSAIEIITGCAHTHILNGCIHVLDYELLLVMEEYYDQIHDIEMKSVVKFQIKKRQNLTEGLLSGI